MGGARRVARTEEIKLAYGILKLKGINHLEELSLF